MGWFDDFIAGIQGMSQDADRRRAQQIEDNKRKLQEKISQPGYRAPLGESGSVIGELLTGRRNNEQPAAKPTNPNWQPTTFQTNAPQYDGSMTDFRMDGVQDPDPTDAIWDRLGQNFDFNAARQGVDTSEFDNAIKQRMALIEQAKGNANSNFQTSDANIKGMYDAFQNDARAQAPAIQQTYTDAGNELKQIFGNTISENNAEHEKQAAIKTEMLQRLGIAPAANAPDVVGDELRNANDAAQQSRDARLVENTTMGQVAQDRNQNFAAAVGNEGLQRRSDLNQQLQSILGDLDMRGADYQDEAMNRKMGYQDKQVDQNYERFLQDRNFDFNQLQERNNYNIGLEQARGQAEADAAKAGDSTVAGFDGLWGQTPDSVKKAVMNVSQKINVEADPQKALRTIAKMAEKDPSINMDEVFQYFNKRATLGTTNKFAAQ